MTYGNLINPPASPLTGHLYTGEQLDARTGQYYLRARYYDSATGRFSRLDPYAGSSQDPLTLHKYLYASGNPVMCSDPTGMFSYAECAITISVISTLVLNIATSVTAVDIMALNDYAIDGWYFSVRGNYSRLGGTIGGGFDIIYENRSSSWWVALAGEYGTSPVSVFVPQRGFGLNVMAGPVFGMSNPQDMSGAGVQAVWPASVLHLLPGVLSSANKAWGAMTQLAKRSKNVKMTDAAYALGVSTSGPSFFQVGMRSNSFSSMCSRTGQFHRINDVSESLSATVRDLADKISGIMFTDLDTLVANSDRFFDVLGQLNYRECVMKCLYRSGFMDAATANRVFRWGSALALLCGVMLGTRALNVAAALVATFLVLFLILDGIRLCILEYRQGEKVSAILVSVLYLVGCTVLIGGVATFLGKTDVAFGQKAPQIFALLLLLLLLVVFTGLLREGVSAISSNVRRKRYKLVVVNAVVLVGVGIAVIIGGRGIAAVFF